MDATALIHARGLVKRFGDLVAAAGRYFGLSRKECRIRADGFCSTSPRRASTFDTVQLVQLPMFLFSATVYPLSVSPLAIQWFVRVSPLYHAIQLIRSLTLGTVGPIMLVHAGYLLLLGSFGIWLARRRMAGLLLT